MEYEYTIPLAEAIDQLRSYIKYSKSGEDVEEAVANLLHNEDGGGYLSASKCMFNNNDGTVDVIEACYAVVELNKDGEVIRESTGSEAYDVVIIFREWLKENPEADIRMFELKEGWDSLGPDSMLNDSKVIYSSMDSTSSVIVVGIDMMYDKDNPTEVIGCVSTLDDCRIIKEWCNEYNPSLPCRFYNFDGTLEDFLTKDDYHDFWFDYVTGEFQV